MQKVAFWRTIGDAYGFVFSDLGQIVRLGAIWGSVIFIFSVAALFLPEFPSQFGLNSPFSFGHKPDFAEVRLLNLPIAVLQSFPYTIFAVAWHRAVLIGERKSVLGMLHFGRREWRFFFYDIRMALVIVAIAVGTGFIFILFEAILSMGTPSPWIKVINNVAIAIAGILLVLFIGGVSASLALGFPAVALDEPSGILRRAWYRGKGNALRLLFGNLFSAVPGFTTVLLFLIIVKVRLLATAGGVSGSVEFCAEILVAMAGVALNLIGLATAISFLSFSYRQLALSPSDDSAAEQ